MAAVVAPVVVVVAAAHPAADSSVDRLPSLETFAQINGSPLLSGKQHIESVLQLAAPWIGHHPVEAVAAPALAGRWRIRLAPIGATRPEGQARSAKLAIWSVLMRALYHKIHASQNQLQEYGKYRVKKKRLIYIVAQF